MKFQKLSALGLVLVAVVMGHPLGCGAFYQCEDDATCPAAEDCYNGTDDDADGTVDCADSDCKPTSMCIDAIPAGWTGYRWMHVVRELNGKAALCADGTNPQSFFENLPKQEHTCTDCKTEVLNAESSCELPALECWDGGYCGYGEHFEPPVKADMCNSFKTKDFLPNYCLARWQFPSLACESSAEPILPPGGSRLDICIDTTDVGAGCPLGGICAAKEFQQVNGIPCVVASGHGLTCPGGWEDKHEAYTHFEDTRQCAQCDCTAWCAWDGYTIHRYDDCHDPLELDSATIRPNTCTSVIAQTTAEKPYGVKTAKPKADSYAAGGAPIGTLTTDNPVTFCCIPGATGAN